MTGELRARTLAEIVSKATRGHYLALIRVQIERSEQGGWEAQVTWVPAPGQPEPEAGPVENQAIDLPMEGAESALLEQVRELEHDGVGRVETRPLDRPASGACGLSGEGWLLQVHLNTRAAGRQPGSGSGG